MSDKRIGVRQARMQQRGAALLLALVVVSVVSTLAAGMVWQQWRSVQAEEADRARSQSQWILQGAVDWARLILREDQRGSQIDHPGEPWAVPLQEARLSSFLAAGRDIPDDNPALQAFLSGEIQDAQARFNVRNLALEGPQGQAAERALRRLCQTLGVSDTAAQQLIAGAQRSWVSSKATGESRTRQQAALLSPQRVSELIWWGVEPAMIEQLRPYLVVLPRATALNLNTARAEVIAAWIDGVDLSLAERLVTARARAPLTSVDQGLSLLQVKAEVAANSSLSVQSSFFEVQGRLRLGPRVFEDRVLVERRQAEVVVLQHERAIERARM